jgi:hypothetical protein
MHKEGLGLQVAAPHAIPVAPGKSSAVPIVIWKVDAGLASNDAPAAPTMKIASGDAW